MGTRWESWVQAVEADERVRNTTSEEGSYRSAYEGPASGEVPAHGMMVWAHPTWMMEAGTRRWEVGDGGDGGVGRVIGP